ncbi:hypothetical protein E1287_21780 [Actinomadura sp. KC06]|uniref:alpha/beta hydrolase n=1 Tax=Actinomadura sp. KC06 TaxID=2530369 RepID=UPI001044E89D|nr:alpha/beta hydrolase [Actinomadura sp. KC06]TDD32733.1 hypothetical protein E1287_21780 [Actinomadura sp. KC06]
MRTRFLSLLAATGMAAASINLVAMTVRDTAGAADGAAPAAPAVREGSFYVGGRDIEVDGGTLTTDQAYVRYWLPGTPSRRDPVVMVHGAGQTGSNFEQTPDGRPGWAAYFVRRGHPVYVVDQPTRGRSAYQQSLYGPLSYFSKQRIEWRFTASEDFDRWPQAKLHTQWPGTGRIGDQSFEQFYRSQVGYLADNGLAERLARDAVIALLERVGPAVVLTHSQSGPFGWLVADKRPALVKAIVGVEPAGPAFHDVNQVGPPTYQEDGAFIRPYGVTINPLSYSPPVRDPEKDLPYAREPRGDGPGLVPCRLQTAPVRSLPRLARTPVLIMTGEASYHAGYDHCTAKYLAQAGARVTYQRLENLGIHGNGHMLMLERNSDQVAAQIARWLDRTAPQR